MKMVEPKDQGLQNSEQVLSSFQEWMIQQAQAARPANQTTQTSNPDNSASPRKGIDISGCVEPSSGSSTGVSQPHPIDSSKQANVPTGASNRSLFEKWVSRAIYGLIIAVVLAVVWQAKRDDQIMKLVQAWKDSSVIWLSDVLGGDHRESAAEPSTKLSDEATPTQAITSKPTKEFTELNEQLQAMASDLAALRRNVEQLSARQEQMSRDVLMVQATEQNVSEKISSLTQPAPIHAVPRKNVPRLVHSETPRQPAPGSVSSQPSATATASPVDQPPRPPLPLPMPAETPSQH